MEHERYEGGPVPAAPRAKKTFAMAKHSHGLAHSYAKLVCVVSSMQQGWLQDFSANGMLLASKRRVWRQQQENEKRSRC